MKNSSACMVNILSRQDVIYYMITEDSTSTGTLEEISLFILSCFLNVTLMHLHFQMTLLNLLQVDLIVIT